MNFFPSFSFRVEASHGGLILLRNFSRNPKSLLEKMSIAGGEKLKEKLSQDMDNPKSGIFYRGLDRRSSAPGESPAVQSGDLKASLKVGRVSAPRGVGRAAFTAGQGLPRSYAFYLEFGAPANNMAPRAFMRRSAEIWNADAVNAMLAVWHQHKRGIGVG